MRPATARFLFLFFSLYSLKLYIHIYIKVSLSLSTTQSSNVVIQEWLINIHSTTKSHHSIVTAYIFVYLIVKWYQTKLFGLYDVAMTKKQELHSNLNLLPKIFFWSFIVFIDQTKIKICLFYFIHLFNRDDAWSQCFILLEHVQL